MSKLEAALKKGFDGLRLTVNAFWLEKKYWKAFTDQEKAVNEFIGKHRIVAVCAYSLDRCGANKILDVIKNHQFALVKRSGKWELMESHKKKQSGEDLLSPAQKFENLYNAMTEGVAMHEIVYNNSGKAVDYVILDVNPSFVRITGLSKEQAAGKRASQLYGIGQPPYLDVYAKVASSGEPTSFETYFPPMKKHFSISVISPSKGKFNTIFYDVTERKNTEEKLRSLSEREHFLAEIVRNASVAVGVGYPDGRLGMVNAAFQKLTGYSEQELHRINWVKMLTPPEYKEFEKEKLAELSKTKQVVQYQKEYIRKDGSRVPIELVVQPYFDDSGKVSHYFSFIRDITTRKKNEKALKRQASLIDLSPDAIFVKKPDDTITFWSQGAQKLYGWTKKEAVGQKSRKLLKTKFPEPYKEILNQVKSCGHWSGEKIHHTKSGNEVIVESRWLNTCNVEGKIGEILETNIDVTERKKAEEAIQQAKRDWEKTFDSVPDLIAVLDKEHRIIRVNLSMAQRLGTTPEHCIGLRCYQCVHGMDMPPEFCPHAKTLMDEQEHIIDIDEPRLGGIFSVSTTPLTDDHGQLIGSVHVARDITESKKYEAALQESQMDLNRAQAVAKTGSWQLDKGRNVLLWSDETYRMFGIQVGTPLTYEKFLGVVHPDDVKYVDAKWIAALKGEPYDIEHRIVANGETKWVHEKAELEFDENKNVVGGFGTVTDITEQKIMREKLEDAAVQLERYANQMECLANDRAEKLKDAERLAAIGATAGMVGHDIRNPLQSIIGELYLAKRDLGSLSKGETKNNLLETIATIEEQVKYINKIVTDLQDFAKPLVPCNEEVDIEGIIQDVTSTIIFPENIKFSYSVETGLSKFMTDAAFMKRILTNLMTNSIQAMPEGGKLTLQAQIQNGAVAITIADSGIGIPENTIGKLFQPLFTTKAKGQGFGLAVCKRLTEAMNGSITFETEEGKGTKFFVKLPKNNKAQSK